MKYLFFVSVIVTLLSLSAVAQISGGTDVDRWNGLKIGVTSPTEALTVMGKPAKDTVKKLEYEVHPQRFIASLFLGIAINVPESWVTPKRNEKIFREITFNRKGIYKTVVLSFLNDKLYLIDLTLSRSKNERVFAVTLGDLHKTDFVSVEDIPKAAKISDYEGQKEPTIPKSYWKFYGMVSITPKTIIVAVVDNDSFKKEFWSGKGETKVQMFPGVVGKVQIFDRINQ